MGNASSTAQLIPANTTVRGGTSIDFTGSGFGREEQVAITLNGQTVGSAHADGGGNFTTGSMSISSTPGTYVYTFTGANSGAVRTSTVTVTQ